METESGWMVAWGWERAVGGLAAGRERLRRFFLGDGCYQNLILVTGSHTCDHTIQIIGLSPLND